MRSGFACAGLTYTVMILDPQYNGTDPTSPADRLVRIPGAYYTVRDNQPAPGLVFGDEGSCMYAKAVTLNLQIDLCPRINDVIIEGTNSPVRQDWRMLARVSSPGRRPGVPSVCTRWVAPKA